MDGNPAKHAAAVNGLNALHHPADSGAQRVEALVRLRCMLRNLPAIWLQAGREPARLPPGTPVLLCDWGASLLSQADILREASHGVLIMATDRAAAALFQEGIQPQVVVSLSSWAEEYWSIPTRLETGCLIAPPEVDPVIAQSFPDIIWMASHHPEIRHMDLRLGLNLPAPCTPADNPAAMLIRLAALLGCEQAALLGFDFCLDAYDRFFPDRERSDEDEMIEIPGVEGRTVKATHEQNRCREAFESALASVKSDPAFSLSNWINCARRGAHIEGTVSQNLPDYLARARAFISRAPVWRHPDSPRPAFGEGVFLEELARLRQVMASFKKNAELAAPPFEPLKNEIQNMMGCGQVLLVELARFLQSTADHLSDAQAGAMSRLALSMAGEMEQELRQAMDRRFLRGPATQRSSAHVFHGLKQLGCDLIAASNPELARFIRSSDSPETPSDLAIEWAGQRRLSLGIPQDNILLTAMDPGRRTEADLADFIRHMRFSPACHGLVILGPADWRHVDEFMARFPGMDAIIVEPWVGLLAMQLERDDLLSRHEGRLLLIGMDARLPSWTIRYSQRINLWRAENRTPQFFIPPPLRRAQKIRAAYEALKRTG